MAPSAAPAPGLAQATRRPDVNGTANPISPAMMPCTRLTSKSTGRAGASFTSSSLTPQTTSEQIAVDEEEVMFEFMSQAQARQTKKALVRLQTNFGDLLLELYANKAPRTCYNFLMLCRQGKYNNTIFHRNIPGFMIQGGDPTGTGRGGESIWGKPFADELVNPGAYRHTSRGIVSMANKGYNTNGSQFFITYRATPHLDTKHTVFGHLISDDNDTKYPVLDALERVPNEPDSTKPIRPIKLIEAQVFEDPFAEYMAREEAKMRRQNPDEEERLRRETKRRKREEDRTTWYVLVRMWINRLTHYRLGTRLAPKNMDAASSTATVPSAPLRVEPQDEHGLAALAGLKPSSKTGPPPRQSPGMAVRRGGFGDFSSW